MPWKGEKDPYKIWLSEIILQQTRVEQGLAYYERFVAAYPTVLHLAKAKDETVMKLWEGLGYYSRCRNLLATARVIANGYKGKFPDTYESIKTLKGVGPYTAAAIASFAYNLPHAVVDGNVFRVLARVFGIDTPTDTTQGKKQFTHLAETLLPADKAGLYNQAIMDFGAVVCKPKAPLCNNCIFNKECVAVNNKQIDSLPVKSKKLVIKKRCFYYLVLQHQNKIGIIQRTGKDIWQGLYQFQLVEMEKESSQKEILNAAIKNGVLIKNKFAVGSFSEMFKQQLSHQLIQGQFIEITIQEKSKALGDTKWVSKKDLKKFAFPQFINQYLFSKK